MAWSARIKITLGQKNKKNTFFQIKKKRKKKLQT